MTTVAIVESRVSTDPPGAWCIFFYAVNVDVAQRRTNEWWVPIHWYKNRGAWYGRRRLLAPKGKIQTFRIRIVEVEE